MCGGGGGRGGIFDPVAKQVSINPSKDHHLNTLGSTPVVNDTYYVSRPLVNWFWRRFVKAYHI